MNRALLSLKLAIAGAATAAAFLSHMPTQAAAVVGSLLVSLGLVHGGQLVAEAVRLARAAGPVVDALEHATGADKVAANANGSAKQ